MAEPSNQKVLTKKQKIKAATKTGLTYVIIPCSILIGFVLLVTNLNIENPSALLSKSLIILFWAGVLGTLVSILAYAKAMYVIFYQSPTKKEDIQESKYDYHNMIYWVMSIALAVLFIIGIIKRGF